MPSRIEINGVEIKSPVARAAIRMVVLPVAFVFVAAVLLLAFVFVGIVLALAMGLILVALAAATPFMLVERRRRQKQLPAPDSDESPQD